MQPIAQNAADFKPRRVAEAQAAGCVVRFPLRAVISIPGEGKTRRGERDAFPARASAALAAFEGSAS